MLDNPILLFAILAGIVFALFIAGIVMLIIKRDSHWAALLAAWFFFSPLVLLAKVRRTTYRKWWLAPLLILFSPLTVFIVLCCFAYMLLAFTSTYSPKDTTRNRSFEEYRTLDFATEITTFPLPDAQLVDSGSSSNWGESTMGMRYKTEAPISRKLINRIRKDTLWINEGDRYYLSTRPDSAWTTSALKGWNAASVTIYPDKGEIEVQLWNN